jgi:hypothetical protein
MTGDCADRTPNTAPTARERLRCEVRIAGGSAAAAKVLGCTRAYVDMLLQGVRTRPGMVVAYRIEVSLGIPMSAWMQGEELPQRR